MSAKFVSLIIILICEQTLQQNTQSDYELNDYFVDNITEYFKPNDNKSENNVWNDLTIYENEVIKDEICSIDDLIDKLLPEDYEEGKLLNVSATVGHINQTFLRIDRIIKLFTNYSNNLSPILQKLMVRFSTIIYEISLPTECMASLAVIFDSIMNRNVWAMKCKF